MDKQEVEKYLSEIYIFQGQMNGMANSIDLLLQVIFERIGTDIPKMLGRKISKFKNCKSTILVKYTGDFDELIKKLERFNEYWNISKHGMVVLGVKKPDH
jgi:hypothetical protein